MRVFGLDPVADPVSVLSRIGYLSEENDLPGWMRVDELIRYSRSFYPAWDDVYAEELRQTFALDPTTKIRNLSRGQKARAGLLIALAYRPELLVLDEPSSGLDPIVRRDILGAIIRTIANEGRTVLFSSHLLEEVEQVADHVTMISRGRIVLSAPLDVIRESHRCVTVRFEEPRHLPPAVAGVLRWDGGDREWTAVVHGDPGELEAAIATSISWSPRAEWMRPVSSTRSPDSMIHGWWKSLPASSWLISFASNSSVPNGPNVCFPGATRASMSTAGSRLRQRPRPSGWENT